MVNRQLPWLDTFAMYQLLGDVAWHNYVAMDDDIHTIAVDDNNWEADLVAKAR